MSDILHGDDHLERSINWKQGLAIALGVPLLILPSLGYLPLWVSAAAILVWGLSTIQGFIQCTAYAELATTFPEVSGVPGFAQHVFGHEDYPGKYDKGKLIGGFAAWSYWFGWTPIMAIFSILIGGYLHAEFPVLGENLSDYQLALISGLVIFAGLFAVNWFGLKDGAILGYILATVSLIPLVILVVAPFVTGHVEVSNITGSWWPTDWAWDLKHILILFGIAAVAHWTAAAWETAAIYGPEYKNPAKDVPKALYACGIICFIMFVLMQASVIGVLGVEGVLAEPESPLILVAHAVFGDVGSTITILLLICAMILIIQTAYLGSTRAMHSMAHEANLPKILGHVNSHGTPFLAMLLIAGFNLVLISMGNAAAVLAASAIGYTFAHGIAMFAYVRASNRLPFSTLGRPFRAPKGWKYATMVVGLFLVPCGIIGLVYLNSLEIGWTSTIVGFGVLVIYGPIWWFTQHENHVHKAAAARSAHEDAGDVERLSDQHGV